VRDSPCPACLGILENFGDPAGTQTHATTFALLDSKTRGPVLSKTSGKATWKGKRHLHINPASRAPVLASDVGERKQFKRHRRSGSGRGGHRGAGGEAATEALVDHQFRGPTARSGLAMATSTLTIPMLVAVGIALCVCGLGGLGMVFGSGSPSASPDGSDTANRPHPAAAWGEGCEDGELSVGQLQVLGREDRFRFERCCGSSQPPVWADISRAQLLSGAAAPPLITDSIDSQLPYGSENDGEGQGRPYHTCWAGQPMRCYPLCLGYCIAPSTATGPRQNYDYHSAVSRVRHDACFGPLGSTCQYECTSSYEPMGKMRCLPGSSTYQGGSCQQRYQQGPGPPKLPPRPKEEWMGGEDAPAAEPAADLKVSQENK
jgi:hypothetical protein